MKIEEVEKYKVCLFMNLKPGEGFIYNKYLFMKTTGITFNTVNLSTGDLCNVGELVEVYPADVTCTYKRKGVE